MMTKQSVHDRGIERRIQQIWKEEKYHLIAVISNVNYTDYAHIPNRIGEIDILKLYSFGKIGIEEVKCTSKRYAKAQEQLLRASKAFQAYNPTLATYIIRNDAVIPYRGK